MKPSHKVLCLLALLLPVCAWAAADPEPAALYERMRHAVHNSDYEGRFVYQVGDRLDAMYVVHRMQNGRAPERLVALDGAPKQVIRGARAVACLDPYRRKISVVGSSSSAHDMPVAATDELGRLYRFELGETVRVAGRLARELLIDPLDDLRFGYRIALDHDTALPLQSVVLDADNAVRSQTLFVDLKTGDQVTPIERDLSALQLAEPPSHVPAAMPEHESRATPDLDFRDLPTGFRLVRTLQLLPAVRHLLLSDGLASVSLYVEPGNESGFEGFSRIGSTDVYGTRLQDMQLTVVGEVPRRTLRLIAEGVRVR